MMVCRAFIIVMPGIESGNAENKLLDLAPERFRGLLERVGVPMESQGTYYRAAVGLIDRALDHYFDYVLEEGELSISDS